MSETSPIRAVFWDFGGVITTSPFDRFREHEQRQGLPTDFIRTVNSLNANTNAWARLERTEISPQEFDDAFRQEAKSLGHDVGGAEVLALLSGSVRPYMLRILKYLKGSFIQVCVTNNANVGDNSAMARDPEDVAASEEAMAQFDHIVESRVEGVRKPDPAFYQIALTRAGVQPHEVVMLDDLGINLKPAKAMGMTTIRVAEPSAAVRRLTHALRMSMPQPETSDHDTS